MSWNAKINQSLHRYNLFLGAERTPVFLSGLIAFLVAIAGFSLLTTVFAVAFWMVTLFIWRAVAKKDPIMVGLFLKHISHQGFYPAKSSCWRTEAGFKNVKSKRI